METRTMIFPKYAALTARFEAALAQAMAKKRDTFAFAGTRFQLVYNAQGKLQEVFAVVGGLAPLPPAFTSHGGLIVNWVTLRAVGSLPRKLKPQPGRYVGNNFGYPGAICEIDPTGVTNEGIPKVIAHGEDYRLTIGLFKRVMRQASTRPQG